MENHDQSFLEIRLDQTGITYFRKLLTTTRWIFIFGMLMVLVTIIHSLLRNAVIQPEKFRHNLPLYIEVRLRNWYTFIYWFFFTWQLWCYWRFARQSNRAIEIMDTAQFNDAFRSLYRSNILALVHLPFSIGMAALDLWYYYNLYTEGR